MFNAQKQHSLYISKISLVIMSRETWETKSMLGPIQKTYALTYDKQIQQEKNTQMD